MWFLDHRLADDSSILEHILQVDQITVVLFLCKIVHIMKMNDSFFVCTDNFLRKKDSLGKVLADLSCHVISLCRVDHRILIGVLLLYFLVHMIDQCKNSVIRCIRLSG